MIRSESVDGYLIEHGPNSIQPNADVESLIQDLGLSSEVVQPNPLQRNRFVVRSGQLVPVPLGPQEMLHSALFTRRGKLRLLAEPFIRRGSSDESVAQFVRRRVGQEFLDYAINPFVAGVYAGDPEQLSLKHAFPRMATLEERYGSLIRGMVSMKWKSRRDRATQSVGGKQLASFAGGMETLPRRLASNLRESLRLKSPVRSVTSENGRWDVLVESSAPHEGAFQAIVSCMPLHRLTDLNVPGLASFAEVVHPPITVVGLGYLRDQVNHALDGFGFLVPAVESEYQVLGALFSSTLFPGRAPSGHVLLTVFLGGMRHRRETPLSEDEAVAVAHQDVTRLLELEGPPVFQRVVSWSRGIPQYGLRYAETLAALDDAERRSPGLFFAGNYREGISVVDTISNARATARRVAEFVRS